MLAKRYSLPYFFLFEPEQNVRRIACHYSLDNHTGEKAGGDFHFSIQKI
jgi:hypothetical protein